MKKTFLLLITLIVSIVAMAGPVTPDEARQNVAKFMNPRRAAAVTQNPEALRLVSTNHYKVQDNTLAPSYYIFNVGKGEGYVIAAADDRVPAVLGYSNRGQIDPDNMPENMKAWLQGYSDQLEYLNSHPETPIARRTVSGEAISPLLGPIEWDQGAPYNNLCPMDGNVHSFTGCVATAMAQIMYFWKYPNANTDTIPGYVTQEKRFQVSGIAAGTTIDWNNMLPQYKGKETDAQEQAVAKLMLMCGTAVQMNYTKDLSTAYGKNVAIALCAYFDYDLGTSYEEHANYRTAVWNQKVYDELKAGHPVYYDGSSSGSGHAFVIDGYGNDDYFHVNWGWGGQSNDYFLLSILDSNNNSGAGATQSADGYSFEQGAIFGAQPNTGVIPTEDCILTTEACAILDTTVYVRSGINQDFVFKVGFTFYNHTINTYTVDTGVGVYTIDGNLYGIIEGAWGQLKPNYGFWDPTAYPYTTTIGRGLESMEFIMRPIYRLHGTEDWKPSRGADLYYITGAFKGDTLKLSGPIFGLTGTLEATGKREVASPLPVTAKVRNKGTEYLGEIFFVVDGEMVGGRHFDLDPGNSSTVDFSFIPKKTGKVGVSVCTRKWNSETQQHNYTPFISDSITVEAAKAAYLDIDFAVDNATNGIIKENVIKLRTTVKNNGPSVYDNDIRVELYKDGHDGKGNYYFEKRVNQTVIIESGQTIDVNFNFVNLEDENYLFIIKYLSEGQWKSIQTNSFTVQTREPDPVPVLSTTAQTANAVKENGSWIVKSDTAFISVTVKNTGTLDYDDNIIVKLYQMTSATSGVLFAEARAPIQLAAGADTTIVVEFPGLEDGASYFYWTYYIANKREQAGSQITPIFTVMLPEQPDGIQMVCNSYQGNVTIYGVNGNKVGEVNATNLQQCLKSLPKGLYIIRSGKKATTIRN